MFYTDAIKQAMILAYDAHKDQVDKSGLPYIYHPFYLATQMKTEATIIVTLLHDVAEDTHYTFENIENKGFTAKIIDALRLLKHDKSEDYLDYIHRIKPNDIARTVKLADLRHNSDESRLDFIDDKAKERLSKYAASIKILES